MNSSAHRVPISVNRRAVFAVFLLVITGPLLSAELEGKAILIADGDTFTLLRMDKTQTKIRLAEIDAPESGQPYGARSKAVLSSLIDGKTVRVNVQTHDRYGRAVGRVFLEDLDVCAEMIRRGAAWAYRRYLTDERLLEIEEVARDQGVGLWATTEALRQPPWEWRRNGSQQDAPSGCNIKGNITSKGKRIYHLPGTSSYGATKIDTVRGERWFCTEKEAQAAGWRSPY